MRMERLANLYLKARGTSMSETFNDYIRRVKAFSTFVGRPRYAHNVANPLHPLALRPKTDPPK
jgi:hypothetical protein